MPGCERAGRAAKVKIYIIKYEFFNKIEMLVFGSSHNKCDSHVLNVTYKYMMCIFICAMCTQCSLKRLDAK